MSDRIETQGKTVDEAVSEALLRMGARRDEVVIKVLEQPKSGFMGFIGGRQARVLVSKKQQRGGSSRGGARRDRTQPAHDLSGDRNASGRGSRRRGGGGSSGGNRDEARGGRGRRSPQQDGAEAPAQARGDSRQKDESQQGRESSGRSRRRSRGGRGRGGRGRQSQDVQNQNGPSQKSPGPAPKEQGRQPRSERTDTAADRKEQPVAARDGQRDDHGRSRRSDRRDAPRAADSSRSSRSRSDRNRDDQHPASGAEAGNGGLSMAAEAPPAPPAEPVEVIDALSMVPSPKEGAERSKPRAWGGLGSKLARKTPKGPVKTTDEPSPASIGAVPPVRKPKVPNKPRTAHVDLRQEAPAQPPQRSGEVLANEIAATEYAQPLEGIGADGHVEALNELASGLLARAGFPCECTTLPGEYLNVKVATDEDSAGMLIGRHGQTVDAIEHLVDRMASNAADDRVRMNLDINDYRTRREETLRGRAQEAVDEVRQTGEAYHFEPMSPRERRVVHMATADVEGLTTYTVVGSTGKHVVLAVDDDRNDGGGDGGDGGGDAATDRN